KKLDNLLQPVKLKIERLDSIQNRFIIAFMNDLNTQIPVGTNHNDGSVSGSTKTRNHQPGGPLRFPDYAWSFYNQEKKYGYEFLSTEVVSLIQHIEEDKSRLAKMAKEGRDSMLNFIRDHSA
ncbi:3597_t:CDS:2, partial [Entrophospora sp. SA101]